MTRVVVVTGSSAGVGRAVAYEFARAGADVALLARQSARLTEARDETERLGVRTIAVPVDVADADQVEDAADRVESELGPIDVWVNNAMATIFAPLHDVTPIEFRRATEVTYLGSVWGTMAALARMRPRDRGTIVQVGSALAYRGIPLQSAYCGAKHALQGFLESLRTELLYEGSRVRVSMVQLPAVNTPQFEWVRSRLPRQPRPVSPVYEPEAVAKAVFSAAQHPNPELLVGWPTLRALLGSALAPGLVDRYLAKTGFDAQQADEPAPAGREDNLFSPVELDVGVAGRFGTESRARAVRITSRSARSLAAVSAAALVAGVIAIAR